MDAHLNLNEKPTSTRQKSTTAVKQSSSATTNKKKTTTPSTGKQPQQQQQQIKPATPQQTIKSTTTTTTTISNNKTANNQQQQEPSIVKQIKKSVSRLDTTSDIGLETLVNVLHHFAFGIEQQQQQQQQQVEIKKSKNQKQLLNSKAAAITGLNKENNENNNTPAGNHRELEEELVIENEFEHGFVGEEFCDCTCGVAAASQQLSQAAQGILLYHQYLIKSSFKSLKILHKKDCYKIVYLEKKILK